MAISNFTHALRSVRTGDAISSVTSIRVERIPFGHKNDYRYQVTGSRADLIAAGVAASDWFPQGRKRVAFSDGLGAGGMHWGIKKRVGDCFELGIWNATAEQCKLLDSLLPLDPLVPVDLEDLARKQEDARTSWGCMIEATWKLASTGDDFRLTERDQKRFLEALRAARAVLNTARIVSVEQEQAALSVARRDQTFQQFMQNQGLRDFSTRSDA